MDLSLDPLMGPLLDATLVAKWEHSLDSTSDFLSESMLAQMLGIASVLMLALKRDRGSVPKLVLTSARRMVRKWAPKWAQTWAQKWEQNRRARWLEVHLELRLD